MTRLFTPPAPPKKRTLSQCGVCAFALGLLAFGSAAPAAPRPQSTPHVASADDLTFTYLDQHTGKLIWMGHASSITGGSAPGNHNNALYGTLRDVNGISYQNGTPADHMTAPVVNVAQSSGVTKVTATGGVLVRSISDHTSVMTCDTAVWNSATNLILGTGHVTLKKRGATQQGPSILIDSKLRSVTMPAPGTGRASGAIIAHYRAPAARSGAAR